MLFRYLLILLFTCCNLAIHAQVNSLVYPDADFPRYDNVRDLYIAPQGTGFALSDCQALYKTTDDGLSWREIDISALRVSTEAIQCAPGTNCTTAYLATNRGLYRTADGGASWTNVDQGRMHEFNFSLPGVIYGSYPGATAFYRSDDDGLTWTSITTNIAYLDAPQFRSATDFGMIGDSLFFRSTDGGASWTNTFKFDNKTALVHLDDEGNYYVETLGSMIYKSTDGGESWTLQTDFAHQYSSYLDLYKDAEDSLHVISFNGSRFSSGDDGLTWGRVGFVRFQPYNRFRRGEGRMMAAGAGLTALVGNADYTGMRSTIGGEQVDFYNLIFQNEDIAYALGEDGEIFRSEDGGDSWGLVSTVENWQTARTKLAPDGTLYTVTNRSEFSRSTNGGRSWQSLTQPNESINGRRVVFDALDNGEVVIMSNAKTIRMTPDTRVVFEAEGGHPSINGGTFDLKMINADTGFIIRWSRLDIYRTADGGQSWDTIPAFGGFSFFTNFEVFSDRHYLIRDGSNAWETFDAGMSWTPIPDRQRFSLLREVVGTDTFGFTRNTLYRTRDGINYEELYESCVSPRAIYRRPGSNDFLSIYLSGIEKLSIDALLSPVFQPRTMAKQLKAWPNPTSGLLRVDLPNAVGGTAALFDLSGRRVIASMDRSGTRMDIDLGAVASGIYLLRYVDNNGQLHQSRIVKR